MNSVGPDHEDVGLALPGGDEGDDFVGGKADEDGDTSDDGEDDSRRVISCGGWYGKSPIEGIALDNKGSGIRKAK